MSKASAIVTCQDVTPEACDARPGRKGCPADGHGVSVEREVVQQGAKVLACMDIPMALCRAMCPGRVCEGCPADSAEFNAPVPGLADFFYGSAPAHPTAPAPETAANEPMRSYRLAQLLSALPTDPAARKNVPLARGCLDYFPAALAEVARLSKAGNDKHNPGEQLHHARGKSTDHADCILRHLADRGTIDPEDGIPHSAKVAWRALALLQEELEAAGLAPLPRGARL